MDDSLSEDGSRDNTTDDPCRQEGVEEVMAFLKMNVTFNRSSCHSQEPGFITYSQAFYSYFTPVILIIGLTGNILSLRVFVSRNMRKLSASTYLAALSTSDIMALVFYVLVDWLRRGLPFFSGNHEPVFLETHGVCQIALYLSYVCRFLSAWFIVTFTVERYIGVCHPLRRKDICGSRCAQKVIGSLVVIGMCLMMYKPILSGVYTLKPTNVQRCTADPNLKFVSFTLDSIFAVSITLVPFMIITVLNTMIIRKLYMRYRRHKQCNVITEESIIRLEFTIILLVVSFVFIMLNLPFFCVWCKQFLLSASEVVIFPGLQGSLLITRVIFYMNYCINFFLYSITGAYFRQELRMLFVYRNKRYMEYGRYSRNNSNTPTPQSWV
ncbi:thyrotropin-releasing hormone receptor-like isoform X2 [Haliotis rufescens]|uniref:thyrotropin-releasing hormone receptor-like isoform X2 n=1 Tax=Haliotis rufescens TaxID=6454 RepID=UPI001EB0341C|nr:thyrotropin-releasing hormone receptor-like isoform X2 [Haliotis rufescens]